MCTLMAMTEQYIVEVWNGKKWAKVRGYEGGPFALESRAERMAQARENAPNRDHHVPDDL